MPSVAKSSKGWADLNHIQQSATCCWGWPEQEGKGVETDRVGEMTIRIKGRDVHFDQACGGILDCDFTELCARPLWTNDYLKITQVCIIIYLFVHDSIPRFSTRSSFETFHECHRRTAQSRVGSFA